MKNRNYWKHLKEASFQVRDWTQWKKDAVGVKPSSDDYSNPSHKDHLHWKIYGRERLIAHLTRLDPALLIEGESERLNELIDLLINHTKAFKVLHQWKDILSEEI